MGYVFTFLITVVICGTILGCKYMNETDMNKRGR
jgi:hypothetical protein